MMRLLASVSASCMMRSEVGKEVLDAQHLCKAPLLLHLCSARSLFFYSLFLSFRKLGCSSPPGARLRAQSRANSKSGTPQGVSPTCFSHLVIASLSAAGHQFRSHHGSPIQVPYSKSHTLIMSMLSLFYVIRSVLRAWRHCRGMFPLRRFGVFQFHLGYLSTSGLAWLRMAAGCCKEVRGTAKRSHLHCYATLPMCLYDGPAMRHEQLA